MSNPNTATKRRQLILIGAAILGIGGLSVAGMSLFEQPAPAQREKPKTVTLTPPGSVDDKDAWQANAAARAKANEAALLESQAKQRDQEQRLTRLAAELDELKKTKAPSAASAPSTSASPSPSRASAVLDAPLPGAVGATRVLAPPPPPPGRPAVGQPPAATLNMPLNGSSPAQPQGDGIELITFGNPTGPAAGATASGGAPAGPEVLGFPVDKRAEKMSVPRDRDDRDDRRRPVTFLPAGSFVRVTMLNGVDAPTGGQSQSNPLPIAFHVVDVANLANRYKLDIKDCRFIGAAWGELSSERTRARTETLTCIIDGETVEMPVRGSVIGPDGKEGVRGRLVSKQGALLANSLFAGSLAGIGRAFQASATITTAGAGGITQTVDPDRVAQAGLGGGVSTAANRLADYYLKAADKLFPVIETDGGQVVEILLTKGAVYQGKTSVRESFRGLLKRNATREATNDD